MRACVFFKLVARATTVAYNKNRKTGGDAKQDAQPPSLPWIFLEHHLVLRPAPPYRGQRAAARYSRGRKAA
jgi:hypothetical protein